MKVLMFTPYFQKEYGSHEYYLVKHLSELGHEIVLVTSRHPYPKYDKNYKHVLLHDENLGNVRIIRLDSYFQVKGVPFLKGIESVLEKEKPDIVHVHDHFQWYSYKLARLKKKFGYKLILTQHLYKLPRQKISVPAFWLIDRLFGGKTIKESDKIIAISPLQKDFLLERAGEEKIVEIPTGIDTEIFHKTGNLGQLRKKFGIKKQKVILSVTRFTEHKDVFTLIKALGILREKTNFLCILVGKGPLEAEIVKEAGKQGIDQNLLIVNYVKQKELPKYYSLADIFVLPSIEEPFGIVLLESLACGTPVIGSNIKSIKNIITKDTGLLFEPGNFAYLSEKIIHMLTNEREFKKDAIQKISKKYSWKKIAKQTEEIYYSLFRKY